MRPYNRAEAHIPDMDQKDRLLLQTLRGNARASLVSLARDIGLSRSATHDRITKLEEQGVITGYTITLAREALPDVRAFFSVQFETSAAQSALVHQIKRLDHVEGVYCLSGDIDALVYCECDTSEQLCDLRDALAQYEGVTGLSTRPILSTSQD